MRVSSKVAALAPASRLHRAGHRCRAGLSGDSLSLKGESENPGCQEAKKKATELNIGALSRMSGNVIHSARPDFIIPDYLSHIMQSQTWEGGAVSAQVDAESAFFMQTMHKDSGSYQAGCGPGVHPSSALPPAVPPPHCPVLTGW